MLSVLIPVYNYDVTALVNELHRQLIEALVDFEIIVMEDGSTLCLEKNREVGHLSNCVYICLESNIGRSAIRNKLADTARYDHLLFLDCDAEVDNEFFIQKYLSFCHEDCVVIGGRIYKDDIESRYSLLSTYGRKRERNELKTAKKSKKKQIFTSPNFLISKSVFNKVRFDESIVGYGHEDTVFGIMLQRECVDFKYIDNPVIHVGIEDNVTFLLKTEKALCNLLQIYRSKRFPELQKKSKVLFYYILLEKLNVIPLCILLYRLFRKIAFDNLTSANPSLLVFDLYKLGLLCVTSRCKNKSME